jgi:hypothetical protein
MTLRNHDLDLDKYFVNYKTGQIAKQAELKNQPLNREIYFSPSGSPLITVHDTARGTCYQDWVIPSASVFIDTKLRYLKQHITLDQYQHLMAKKLLDTVQQIYQQHNRVYLSYSGGIDSMTILSAVLALGLAARTTLVVFENHSQSHQDCLHQDHERKRLVDEVCQQVRALGAQVETEIITINDLLISMQYDLAETKCYVTHALLRRHADRAWMFGHHGNQLYLHKDVFLDEILYRNPSRQLEVEAAVVANNYYTKNLKNYTFDRPLVPLHQRHLMLKPWTKLDEFNGCKIYSPIGPDNETFDWCRSVDFSIISADTITHALVPKWIINYNNQSWLTKFITTESVMDMDTLGPVNLPVDQIDSALLTVPQNIHHHPDGLDWIQHELDQSKTTGSIAINTMVSLKNLAWLGNL